MRTSQLVLCQVVLIALCSDHLLAQSQVTASAKAKTAVVCKDGTFLSSALPNECNVHGGVGTTLRPTMASEAPPGTVSATCKDGTSEIDSPNACAKHGGVANRFIRVPDTKASTKRPTKTSARRAHAKRDSVTAKPRAH